MSFTESLNKSQEMFDMTVGEKRIWCASEDFLRIFQHVVVDTSYKRDAEHELYRARLPRV